MPAISVSSRARRSRRMAAAPILGVDHDLGDQVVVLGRDAVAGLDGRVDPDTGAGRHLPAADAPGRRGEVAGRVLGGDPDLDGVTGRLGRACRGGDGLGRRAGARRPARTARGRCRGRRPARSRHAPPGAGCSPRGSGTSRPGSAGTRPWPRSGGRRRRPGPPGRGARGAGRRSGPGAGASSTSFWWRRWIEQSRSPIATTVPPASPSSWTSICRAGTISRSR